MKSGGEGWRADPAHAAARMVGVSVDGRVLHLPEGQSLAVALAMEGQLALRQSPNAGTPRGMFCLMGSCQECLVHVDGVPVLSCLEPVRAGMVVALDLLSRGRAGTGA